MLERRRGAVIAGGGLLEVEAGGGGKIGDRWVVEQIRAGLFAETGSGETAGVDPGFLGELTGLLEIAAGLGKIFAAGIFQREFAEHEGGEGALVATGFRRQIEQFFPSGLSGGEIVFGPGDGSGEIEGKFLRQGEIVRCGRSDFLGRGNPGNGKFGSAKSGDFGLVESGVGAVAIGVGRRRQKPRAPVGEGAEGFFCGGRVGGFLVEEKGAM